MNEIEVKYKNWFQQLIGIIHDGMRRFNSYWNLVLTCFHCALLSYAILDRVSHVCEELESDVCLISTLLDDFLQHKTVDLEVKHSGFFCLTFDTKLLKKKKIRQIYFFSDF